MNYLKNIRNRLGLTQADFADLLGCNRVQLAYAEGGQRSLPLASEKILRLLAQVPEGISANKNAVENKLTATEQKLLAKEIRVRNLKLSKLKMVSEDLDAKIEACRRRQQVAAQLLQQVSDTTSTLYLQLQIIQRKAVAKRTANRQQLHTCLIEMAGQQAAIATAEELQTG